MPSPPPAPFLSLVRPGDRTSFIPSAREAGEFIARIDTLLRTQKTPLYLPLTLKGENQKSPFKTSSRPLPLFGAAWRPHLLYPLCEGGGGVHRPHRHPSPLQKTPSISPLKRKNPKSPFKTPSGSPLKGEKSYLPSREGQGESKSSRPYYHT